MNDQAERYTLCEIKTGETAVLAATSPEISTAPIGARPAGRRPRPRRRRQWLISPEGFRELRHSCLLSNRKAAAAYLGVCVRTIRHWDAGRCRVPWSAVRLLRLLRAGELGGLLEGWDGWTIFRDCLVSPDGRAYRERDMRHLWLTLTQAQLFREGYDAATAHAQLLAAGAADSVHGGAEGVERPSLSRYRRQGEQRTSIRETVAPLAEEITLPRRPAFDSEESKNLDLTEQVMRGRNGSGRGARSALLSTRAPGLVLFVNKSGTFNQETSLLQPESGASLPCAGTDFAGVEMHHLPPAAEGSQSQAIEGVSGDE